MAGIIQNWEIIVLDLGIVAGAALLGFIIHLVVFRILSRISKRTSKVIDDFLVKHTRRPLMYLFMLLAINIAIPLLNITPGRV